MSPDPHAPTPAGPDPDAATEVPSPDAAEPDAAEPTPTVPVGEGTLEQPAGTAAPESDWLEPDASTAAATPEPDPVLETPSSFTPPGTPEPGIADKAQAVAEKPEAMVGLAFLGGAVASLLLKRLGR